MWIEVPRLSIYEKMVIEHEPSSDAFALNVLINLSNENSIANINQAKVICLHHLPMNIKMS